LLKGIKESIKHDAIHNDGMMISVTLKEMKWLIERAENVEELEKQCELLKVEIEHILGEVRWYAGKDNFYTIQQSLKEFREGVNKNG
jgi:hypothetical protein